jgi:hypothetical protein
MAVSGLANWWFVWRHQTGVEALEDKPILQQVLWVFLDFVMPFLPSVFVVLSPEGVDLISKEFSNIFIGILSVVVAIYSTGLALSSVNYIINSKEDEENILIGRKSKRGDMLSDTAKAHLNWTTALTGIVGIGWWIIFVISMG